MAELTPIPSAQRPSDTGYQPLSGYAIAAIIVAVSFVVIGLILLSVEMLVLAIIGIVLAAVASSQIKNSEGTRTGLRLASAAWWICMLGGVGLGAYLYANALRIKYESARASDELFEELTAGRYQHAFENFMVPPEERRVGPEAPREEFEAAYSSAGYSAFLNHEMVRLFQRNGESVTYERIGAKDVGEESGTLRATHTYRLTCPEGIFEVQVGVIAPDPKKGTKRHWRIPSQPAPGFSSMTIVEHSQYGRLVMELERDGASAAQSWTAYLSNGHVSTAHLMTTPASHQTPMLKGMERLSVLGGSPASLIPPGPGLVSGERAARWEERLAAIRKKDESAAALGDLAFEDLASIGFFRRTVEGGTIPSDRLSLLRNRWQTPNLMAADPRSPSLDGSIPPAPRIELTRDKIRVIISANLMQLGRPEYIRCEIAVECTDNEVLAAVNAARERGLDSRDDGSLTLATLPPRGWHVAWLQTDAELRSPPAAPGGPNR